MITAKSQFLQLTLSAITFVFVIGVLSMIWPGIIALFFAVLWLLQCRTGDGGAVVGRGRECVGLLFLFSATWASGDAFVMSSSGGFVCREHSARRG
jgi:hypothetical protein